MSNAFHQSPFHVRFGAMGDVAEKVFEDIFPAHHRLGLNRPNLHTQSLPYIMRFLPDFLTVDGMIEVMGVGRDKTLKFKIEKMNALARWQQMAPVHLFVYDSSKKRWWISPLEAWQEACISKGTIDHFDDNKKAYVKLLTDDFPSEPTKYDAASNAVHRQPQ